MNGYKVLSVASLFFLISSLILFVLALNTNYWIVGKSKVSMLDLMNLTASTHAEKNSLNPLQEPDEKSDFPFHLGTNFTHPYPMLRNATPPVIDFTGINLTHLYAMSRNRTPSLPDLIADANIKVMEKYGLTLLCYEITIIPKVPIGDFPQKKCLSYEDIKQHLQHRAQEKKEIFLRIFKKFNTVYYCMIAAVVLTVFGTIVAFLKTPCINLPKKKIMLLITTVTSIFGEIAACSAIFIFENQLYKPYADKYLSELQRITTSSPTAAISNFSKLLQPTFDEGSSFTMIIFGCALLMMGIFLNVIEFFLARHPDTDEEYSTKLNECEEYDLA